MFCPAKQKLAAGFPFSNILLEDTCGTTLLPAMPGGRRSGTAVEDSGKPNRRIGQLRWLSPAHGPRGRLRADGQAPKRSPAPFRPRPHQRPRNTDRMRELSTQLPHCQKPAGISPPPRRPPASPGPAYSSAASGPQASQNLAARDGPLHPVCHHQHVPAARPGCGPGPGGLLSCAHARIVLQTQPRPTIAAGCGPRRPTRVDQRPVARAGKRPPRVSGGAGSRW